MQKRHWIALAGVVLSMALPASGALAAQDGTGGPEMATPNPSLCDRELVSEEEFAAFATPTGAFFSDAIEPVDAASIADREEADAETVTEIEATLRSYEACVVRDGAIGAYAFLNPEKLTDGGRITPDQGAGAVIHGMVNQVGNGIDEFVVDTLRNNLLGLPLDLATINMVRAREAGVPTLQEARRTYYRVDLNPALKPYESCA